MFFRKKNAKTRSVMKNCPVERNNSEQCGVIEEIRELQKELDELSKKYEDVNISDYLSAFSINQSYFYDLMMLGPVETKKCVDAINRWYKDKTLQFEQEDRISVLEDEIEKRKEILGIK